MKAARRAKEPSFTSRVEATLRATDDFMTIKQIAAASGVDAKNVRSALGTLHKLFDGAAFIVEAGKTYWYLTPETDKRCRKVEERVVEEPGNRSGGAAAKKTAGKKTFGAEANEIAARLREAVKPAGGDNA